MLEEVIMRLKAVSQKVGCKTKLTNKLTKALFTRPKKNIDSLP